VEPAVKIKHKTLEASQDKLKIDPVTITLESYGELVAILSLATNSSTSDVVEWSRDQYGTDIDHAEVGISLSDLYNTLYKIYEACPDGEYE
jgi:hypothetical protein